ncbi:MAG: PAS domain S-box protein [Daejeonella sp.]
MLNIFKAFPSPCLLLSTDAPNFTIAGVNQAYLEATGAIEEDVKGVRILDSVPYNDDTHFNQSGTLLNSLKTVMGSLVPDKMKIQKHQFDTFGEKLSESVYWNCENRPVFDDGGKLIYIMHSVQSVSDAEYHVQLSGECFKKQMNNSAEPRWIFELDSLKILEVNEAAISHYGYNRDEFLSMTINDIRPQDEIPAVWDTIKNNNGEMGIIHFGVSNHLKKDQSLIKVEIISYRCFYQNKECSMIICRDVTERELTLKKLKDDGAKLVTAQKNGKLGYWIFQPSADSLYWSEEIYSIWGLCDKECIINEDLLMDSIHPEDRAGYLNERADFLKGIKDHDYEHRIILPDGSVKWVHEKGKSIKNTDNQFIAFEGTVQDVTEKKLALEKLLISEARHRGIVESQTNYVIRTDLSGNYTYYNKKFNEDFAWLYPNEEILGNNLLDFVMDYHHERIKNLSNIIREKLNEVFQVEIDKRGKNGEIKTTLWDIICLTDAHGKPQEVQCMGIDITARIKAERALKQSNTRYEYVNKATSEAIWDWDILSGLVYHGEGFKTIFGQIFPDDRKEFQFDIGKIHAEDINRVESNIANLLEGIESNWEDEYRYELAGGQYAFVVNHGFVIRDEQGKAVRMVGAMKDISERKKLEELLAKTNSLARIGSFEINYPNNTLYWSDMTREIHELDELQPPSPAGVLKYFKTGESREKMEMALRQAIDNGISWDLELQIVTAKGTERWVRVNGEAEFTKNKCIKLYGSFQDIDVRKRAELATVEALEDKEIILESIDDAFFAVDKNFIVTYWNNRAEKLLLAPKSKMLGACLWERFSESIGSESYIMYHQALETKKAVHFVDYFDPLKKHYEISAYPSESGLSVYFKDVTERLNYLNKIEEQNKKLREIAFIQSHIVRAPLAGIMGLVDLMQSPSICDSLRSELMDKILICAHELDGHIRDICHKTDDPNL